MTRFGPTINIGNLKYDQAIEAGPLRRRIGRLVDNFIDKPYLESRCNSADNKSMI